MKVFDSSKYELVGYDDGCSSPYKGWVLRERSVNPTFTPQLVIIDNCKFVNNGVVYYLESNGSYNVNNRSNRSGMAQALALNYVYTK